jgi:2-desacetyl-2-hydroxyethyl bacteriochlorophyllide A dehydrogenase
MSTRVLFPTPGKALLEQFPAPTLSGPDDVLLETEFSVVSAGTELACLSGLEGWAPLPFCPGYGSVGRITAIGDKVKHLTQGQRIMTYGKHAKHAHVETLAVPVPEGLDPAEATFARIAAVAITALRASDAELGDRVAVIGLGLVGNLAAQLFSLSGCEVFGIDPSPARRKQAEACGIAHTLASGPSLRDEIAALTNNGFCETVVDATGLSSVIIGAAPQLVAPKGEIVLLGSPRASQTADVTPFLSQLHLCRPTATVKGSLEWRYPVAEDPQRFVKHSMERNVRQILELLRKKKLIISPLITHRVSPSQCQSVYDGLRDKKDVYTGVVFDWSKV